MVLVVSPLKVAEIETTPGATAVTRPVLLIVARLTLLEAQLETVTSFIVSSLNISEKCICRVAPTNITGPAGVIATLTTLGVGLGEGVCANTGAAMNINDNSIYFIYLIR